MCILAEPYTASVRTCCTSIDIGCSCSVVALSVELTASIPLLVCMVVGASTSPLTSAVLSDLDGTREPNARAIGAVGSC